MWVRVELRGGHASIHERMSGQQFFRQQPPELGPPFVEWRAVSPVYPYRLEKTDGKVSITLIMPSDSAQGVTVEKTITVGAGNFVRIDHRVLNTTDAAQKFKLRCGAWSNIGGGKITLPLKDGLLHEVNLETCVKCGACIEICPEDAIEKRSPAEVPVGATRS